MKKLFALCFLFILISYFADGSAQAASGRRREQPAPVASAEQKPAEPAPQQSTLESQPRDARVLDDMTQNFITGADAAPGLAPGGGTIPPARIEEAELAFMRAWRHFIMRNYWQALTLLDEAQSANIFLVDVYYLRGLILRRIGEFDLANRALSNFLEVRARDAVAPNVIKGTSENKAELESLLSGASYPIKWNVSRVDLHDSLDSGYLRPYSPRGFGKLSGFGSDLCFADTVGDRVFFRPKDETGQFYTAMDIESPVKSLLPGDGSMYAVKFDGEILRIINETSFDLMGKADCDSVSDACYVSASEIALADPVARKILFYSWPELRLEDEWQPDELDDANHLFEPVAVKAYAHWLAAADRANGRIYFMDMRNKRYFFVEETNVRDIIWSDLGVLLSLNENAEISAYSVDFVNRAAAREVLRTGLDDAWAFFEYKEEIFCSDISGESVWKITPSPDLNTSLAYVSLYDPHVESDAQGNSVLSVSASLSTPFTAWWKEILPTAMSIWNDSIVTTSVTKTGALPVMGLCFSRGNVDGMVSPNMRVIPVESCAELYGRLPLIWGSQRDLITSFILDSLIIYDPGELLKLTAFCLFNGIKIDVWARGIPSVELMKASAATGGEIYYSLAGDPALTSHQNGLTLKMLLPIRSEASGYSDRSTLSSYLSVRQLSASDWIPVWVDAVSQ